MRLGKSGRFKTLWIVNIMLLTSEYNLIFDLKAIAFQIVVIILMTVTI